jgi:hypothetical protein
LDSAVVRRIRARQLQIVEESGLELPAFTVWDPAVPDCRVRDPKKHGLIRSSAYGPLTRIYCVACGKPAPLAAWGEMLKMVFKCNGCVRVGGAPPGTVGVVPGTESF